MRVPLQVGVQAGQDVVPDVVRVPLQVVVQVVVQVVAQVVGVGFVGVVWQQAHVVGGCCGQKRQESDGDENGRFEEERWREAQLQSGFSFSTRRS